MPSVSPVHAKIWEQQMMIKWAADQHFVGFFVGFWGIDGLAKVGPKSGTS